MLVRDHDCAKINMSKPIRDALLALDPLVPVPFGTARFSDICDQVGFDAAKRNPEVRMLLQRLGTEVGRNLFGENFWVDQVFSEVRRIIDSGGRVAVTGVRYQNELTALKDCGGVSVWVERPHFAPVNQHASDNALFRCRLRHGCVQRQQPGRSASEDG